MLRGPVRFRFVLPVVFGFLTIVLMLWDYENNRMVQLMGMGWDLGPPFWPYQVVQILLFGINMPAFILSIPSLKLLNLQTLSLQYAVWFPAILGMWWWLGKRIDFGIVTPRQYRHSKRVAALHLIVSLATAIVGIRVIRQEVQWWKQYGGNGNPFGDVSILRAIAPVFWSAFFSVGCLLALVRMFRYKGSSPAKSHFRFRIFVVLLSGVAIYLFAIHRYDRALNPPFNYDECAVDRLYAQGCVHGTVQDETGHPVRYMRVDLIPTFKTGDARWYATRSVWTDDQGRFNFNEADSGKYLVAANSFSSSSGPDAEQPFATVYYPAASTESAATAIVVSRSSEVHLTPLRLRKLELATIRINVKWADGSVPERSNILFINLLYRNGGQTAPQIDQGSGVVTLPKGFDYDAMANVQCDAGNNIRSRESKPYQRIRVFGDNTPTEMTFVIAGPQCALWKPQ